MKKIIVAAVIFLTVSVTRSSAQDYTTALGVKFWDGGGITLKHFFNEQNAGELIGYFWSQGARFTGLYEIHGDISNAGGLRWYIGPGAHVGFYNSKYGDGAYFGVDGVLGLDYKFNNAPINLSLDWQPSIEFGSGRGFYGGWGGLGVRYTFGN
ncbi:MAG: hypothetical protein JNN29_02815 [Chitinophagaceae bacterium]|nr:hypothetical protein [Chitinophagaceae bacterium]MBN8666842.1 hypothetical protein [Chitinophagales bacterium]